MSSNSLTYWTKEQESNTVSKEKVLDSVLSLLMVQHMQVKEYNNYWLVAHELLEEILDKERSNNAR